MCENEIGDAKRAFLAQYNPGSSIDVALNRSIGAAVMFNPLYHPQHAQFGSPQRLEIRTVWAAYLRLIAARFIALMQNNEADPNEADLFARDYPAPANLPQFEGGPAEDGQVAPPAEQLADRYARYESLICGLRSAMNRHFRLHFRESGFRISHSQKSISVFLKHLWLLISAEI